MGEQQENSVATRNAMSIRAAREVAAIGAKLWRLQQAQRAINCSGDGGMVSVRGKNRPLYNVPPPRRAGDDIAGQLLAEMSKVLRELEEGLAVASQPCQ